MRLWALGIRDLRGKAVGLSAVLPWILWNLPLVKRRYDFCFEFGASSPEEVLLQSLPVENFFHD